MKTKVLLLFFILSYNFTSNASTSLRVQDPRQTWKNYQGVIDTAVFSIKPKGAYFECGLYLTFSSRPQINSYDTFEVQMHFDLPEGSIMHDSWLWVNGQIIQANLIDRVKATLTYEGIVRRRQDPSILYKNSPTQYELRIFPQPANQTRKVKLTYLVPAEWGESLVKCPLPLDILKASAITPHFQVLSYNDFVWQVPRIAELPTTYFQIIPGNAFTTAIIPSSAITGNTSLSYALSSPMQNGVYAAKYETSPTDGYYQVVVVPSQAFNTNLNKKTALLFDYEANMSNTTPNQVLAKAKEMLHQYFSPSDSFNLIFSQPTVYRASNTWLPCDSMTIESTFNHLQGGNPISNYSNLPALIGNGIYFLKTTGATGELVLISNSDNQSTSTVANQLITDIQTVMSPYSFPINVLEYTDRNFNTYYIGNNYYAGNEYFYKHLSALTGGTYERMLVPDNYYYYYLNTRSFNSTTTELFETLDGKITNFDVHPVSQNGFCYAKHNSNTNGIAPVNRPYIQLGKYSGSAPDQVEITGVFNALPFLQTINIAQTATADELTKKMWVGNYIQMLENGVPDQQTKAEIVDSSIRNRVLCLYTAFLALEPSDTTHACNDCEDETSPPTVGLDQIPLDSIMLLAKPNPFSGQVAIQIHLASSVKESSLQIYNLMGQVVKTMSLDLSHGNDFTITWHADDQKGESVSAGIYLVVLSTGEGRQTLKLVKN